MDTLLKDEQGHLSTARCAFWLVTLCAIVLLVLESLGWIDELTSGAYTLLTTMFVVTGGWAAGPRIAQYLFPQLGATLRSVAIAVRARVDDRFQDDERGS